VEIVVERRRPAPLRATRMPPRSWSARDPRAVPRFLAGFFLFFCWFTIVAGAVGTLVVDLHLATFHNSGAVILSASTRILASTAVTAAFFAFFSYALKLLLELVDRPSGTSPGHSAEGTSTRGRWV
jgi:hypothetical protein